MRQIVSSCLSLLLVAAIGSAVTAGDGIDDCGKDACTKGACCDTAGGLIVEAEALWFKYARADGTSVGDSLPGAEHVSFDYNLTPRLTVGWVSNSGLGVRARYFEYDQSEAADEGAPSALSIDTYTLDLEIFERICLNSCWDVELSGGVRYTDFEEIMQDAIDTRVNAIHGIGGIAALQANRSIGCMGSLYGRIRGALMADDKLTINDDPTNADNIRPQLNAIQGMTELALGYELRRETSLGTLTLRTGYEWQIWHNFSSEFVSVQSPDDDVFAGPSDVGFHGFTLMAGLEY
jgi:hypothetical protein